MLVDNDSRMDRDRYIRVCSKAVGDVSEAFNQHCLNGENDNAYRLYWNADILIDPGSMAALTLRENLVHKLCSALQWEDEEMVVNIYPISPSRIGLGEGFVSWLVVNFGDRTLTILFDPDVFSLDSRQDQSGRNDSFCRRHQMSVKAFLHECGHASLHLQEFCNRITPENPRPRLDQEHEQEAWLYAMVVWGILLGDHSNDARMNRDIDDAWILS